MSVDKIAHSPVFAASDGSNLTAGFKEMLLQLLTPRAADPMLNFSFFHLNVQNAWFLHNAGMRHARIDSDTQLTSTLNCSDA